MIVCLSSLDFHVKVFIALTFNTVMYKNGKPFFNKWNVVILCECIICSFDACMGMFMKIVKNSFEESKWKTYSNRSAYKIWSRRLILNSRVFSLKANKVCGVIYEKL